MGRGKKNKHRQTCSRECSLFWYILGVVGFLPCEQKGENQSPYSVFPPARKVFVCFYRVTPDVLSVYRLLLGLSACRRSGECPLSFLLSNLLYSIATHCFYYGFCADDTPLFSKRRGPPLTRLLTELRSVIVRCFSTTGCTPQWCQNLFLFFFPFCRLTF